MSDPTREARQDVKCPDRGDDHCECYGKGRSCCWCQQVASAEAQTPSGAAQKYRMGGWPIVASPAPVSPERGHKCQDGKTYPFTLRGCGVCGDGNDDPEDAGYGKRKAHERGWTAQEVRLAFLLLYSDMEDFVKLHAFNPVAPAAEELAAARVQQFKAMFADLLAASPAKEREK